MSKNFTFSQTPIIKRSRSKFDLSCKRLTSGNMGKLIPFYVQEVVAGDTFKLTANCVVRTSSPLIRPVMDNLFLDTYFFYVPYRLLYDKWVNIFGENTQSAWANTQEYSVPVLPTSSTTVRTPTSGSVADYLGLPLMAIPNGVDVSVLPFRGFAKIWDEWFRDQNNVQPMHIQTGETVASEGLNSSDWSPNNYTGKLPNVAKFHDYFTSCLPSPQKGSAVEIGAWNTAVDVPVYTGSNINDTTGWNNLLWNGSRGLEGNTRYAIGVNNYRSGPSTTANYTCLLSPDSGTYFSDSIYPANLFAQTSDLTATAVSVNDLRLAFQMQKMLERDARGGTRYCEYLLSHFGVSAGDARLQRSEFLGGKRTPLNISQVTQTAPADVGNEMTGVGDLSATSLTFARARSTKGFVEPGLVFGVACIRQFHTYQQGVERFWTRKKRTDFYDPVFANIGEQPVYRSELYATAVTDDGLQQPFGYGEAWADMRYRPNQVTGQMRSGVTNSLDVWHLADNYLNAPTLSAGFIEETPKYLDRVLTVESGTQDQFILDFYVQNIAYRPLPTYSIPSLIDHN